MVLQAWRRVRAMSCGGKRMSSDQLSVEVYLTTPYSLLYSNFALPLQTVCSLLYKCKKKEKKCDPV